MTTEALPNGTNRAAGFDLTDALAFPFRDPDWVPKFLMGSLFVVLSPLLVGSIFLVGYGILVAKQRIAGRSDTLPEWDDLQSLLIDGLKGFAISLAHKLPVFILTLVLMLSLFGGFFLSRDGGEVSDALLYFGLPAVMGASLLVFVVSFAILVYVPGAFVRFIQTGRLGAAFDVMDVVGFIRANTSNYVIGLLTLLLASMIGQAGFLLFCVGILPSTFWSVCVAGYVAGELARLDVSPPSQS